VLGFCFSLFQGQGSSSGFQTIRFSGYPGFSGYFRLFLVVKVSAGLR
jgi:hypothetical protein